MNRAGLALGTLFAAMHALWIVAVWRGAGAWFLDGLHGYHFVTNPYTLTAFDAGTALIGVAGAFVSGYVLGFGALLLWKLFEAI